MIDDEKDIVYFFEKTLPIYRDIRFFTSTHAAHGIELARRVKPAIILLDLKMPGTSGEEVIRILRSELPGTKFVILTGWDDRETRERIEKNPEVAAYFQKPVDLETVTTTILKLAKARENPS